MAKCFRVGQAVFDNIIWCMLDWFPRQQWLLERASLLCYRAMYIAFLVACWDHFSGEMLRKEAD